MPMTMNPNTQPQVTPEQSQQAQQQVQALLQEANLPAEKLVEIGQWAQRVIQNPSEFSAFQAWLKEQGLPESEIPTEPDYQELISMVTLGHVAQGMVAEPQESAEMTSGPVSPEQLSGMANQGRMGDTMLAHINPQEAAVLESMGGMGTINPATGLPEYGFFSDLWKGVKKVAKQVAPFVLPIVAIAFPALIPAIGTALGASAALAPVIGAAAIAGGVTALSGGSVKDVLKSAALTGLGAYLTPIVGEYVGSAVGVTSPGLQSAIGSATLAGGMTALRGGTVSQILASAATGAASNYLGQIAGNAINSGKITNTNINQKVFDDAVFAAADAKGLADAGIGQAQITQVLQTTGMQAEVANAAAAAAKAGQTADQIAVTLSNRYGGTTFGGQKSLYQNSADPAAKSLIGGANVPALEAVQRAEDALFVGEAAKSVKDTLAGQGITGRAAQPAIEQNLVAMGIDPKAAAYAANAVVEGRLPTAIGDGLNTITSYKGVTLIGTPPQSATAVTPGLGAASLGETPVTQTTGPVAPTQTPGGNVTEAEFLAADAQQLAAQTNNNTAAVQQNLQASGVDPVTAAQVAGMATSGATTQQIVNTITPPGQSQAPVYNQAPAGMPANAQEAFLPDLGVMGYQASSGNGYDYYDQNGNYIRTLRYDAQGNMEYINKYTGAPIGTGQTTQTTQPAQTTQTQTVSPGIPTGAGAEVTPIAPTQISRGVDMADAAFYAADAAQLAAQGIGSGQISELLRQSGLDYTTSLHMGAQAASGASAAQLAEVYRQIAPQPAATTQTPAQTAPQSAATETPSTTQVTQPVTPPPATNATAYTPPANAQAANIGGGQQGWSVPRGNGIYDYYDNSGNYVKSWSGSTGDYVDAMRGFTPQDVPGGNVTEAEFIAADAAQLAQQTNNNTAAVQQNLVYAGVDPAIAAQAAQMATSGATQQQITQAIAGDVTEPPRSSVLANPVVEEPALGTGIRPGTPSGDYNLVGEQPVVPGGDMGGGTGITEPVYPNLPEMGGGQGIIVPGVTPEITTPVLTPEPPPLTDSQTGAIVATPVIPDPTVPPTMPRSGYNYNFTPAPPNERWTQDLQYPGVNPGLIGAAIRPAYETTSPVQAQYYWGRQPYFAYNEDLANYNQVAMPITPFGIQQGFFERPVDYSQLGTYGANMMPFQAAAPAQAYAAPMTYAPAVMPGRIYPSPLESIRPVAPTNTSTTPYVYSIAPAASQYTPA